MDKAKMQELADRMTRGMWKQGRLGFGGFYYHMHTGRRCYVGQIASEKCTSDVQAWSDARNHLGLIPNEPWPEFFMDAMSEHDRLAIGDVAADFEYFMRHKLPRLYRKHGLDTSVFFDLFGPDWVPEGEEQVEGECHAEV